MKIRFITDFAKNWKAGEIVEVQPLPDGDTLVDNVAIIDTGLLREHCEVVTESDGDEGRMTLDEAIKYTEEVAEEKEKEAKEWHENQVRKCKLIPFSEMDYTCENECKQCAEKHRQLAEWLKELKQLKEQEFCEDCISRKAMEKITWEEPSYTDALNVLTEVREKVRTMPPVTPRSKWFPVNERSPMENGWYQCTVAINDLPQTMELFYKNGKWLDNRRINMFNTYDIYGYGNTKEKHKLSYQELIPEFEWTENVIAWQPLTEPYREREEYNTLFAESEE